MGENERGHELQRERERMGENGEKVRESRERWRM